MVVGIEVSGNGIYELRLVRRREVWLKGFVGWVSERKKKKREARRKEKKEKKRKKEGELNLPDSTSLLSFPSPSLPTHHHQSPIDPLPLLLPPPLRPFLHSLRISQNPPSPRVLLPRPVRPLLELLSSNGSEKVKVREDFTSEVVLELERGGGGGWVGERGDLEGRKSGTGGRDEKA